MIIRAQPGGPLSQRLRRHPDAALVANQPVLDDRQLRKLPMHIHPDIPHHHTAPFTAESMGNRWTERHLRIRAHSAAGPVAGAANY